MFAAQIDYWNDMMKKVQDTYTTSINSGTTYQKEFAGFLKEMMETTYNINSNFQKEAAQIGNRMTTSSMDQMNRFSRFYTDRMEENFDQVKELMEKHNIKSDDFRKEMEFIWNQNTETFNKQAEEMMSLVKENSERKTQRKFFRLYQEFFQERYGRDKQADGNVGESTCVNF